MFFFESFQTIIVSFWICGKRILNGTRLMRLSYLLSFRFIFKSVLLHLIVKCVFHFSAHNVNRSKDYITLTQLYMIILGIFDVYSNKDKFFNVL